MKSFSSFYLPSFTLITMILATSAHSADVVRNTSVFSEPTESSEQVKAVKTGSHLQVTGFSKRVDGDAWVPVQLPGEAKGWIKTNTIELTEGDLPYSPGMKNRGAPTEISNSVTRSRVNFLASAGAADVTSSGRARAGFRAALGADFGLGDERRFFIGPAFSKVWSREGLEGSYSGSVNRNNLMFTAGHFITPDELYARLLVGFSFLGSDNSSVSGAIKETYGAGLGYLIPIGTQTKLGLEFTFEHTGRTEEALGSLFSFLDPRYAIFPAANIFSLNLTYRFTL